MPEKIYDGITAVNLRRTKNDFEMMTALLLSRKFFKNFSEMMPNLASPSANITRGLSEFFVNIFDLGRTNAFSQWE